VLFFRSKVAEHSGLTWEAGHTTPTATATTPTATATGADGGAHLVPLGPLGRLPALVVDGHVLVTGAAAVVSVVARLAGPLLEGSHASFAHSQVIGLPPGGHSRSGSLASRVFLGRGRTCPSGHAQSEA
jgi:hypothetical protein